MRRDGPCRVDPHQRGPLRRVLISSALVGSSLFGLGCSGDSVPDLGEGPRPAVEMVAGDSRTFAVELARDEVLRVRAEQQGVDVVQQILHTARGEVLMEEDSLSGFRGPETLIFRAERSGRYLLRVEAIGGRGELRLEVEELGPASAASLALLAARRRIANLDTAAADGPALSRRALDELPQSTPAIERARLWWRLGRWHRDQGRLGAAAEVLGAARRFFVDAEPAVPQSWELATLLNDLADLHLVVGRLDAARQSIDDAQRHAEEVEHPLALAVAWSNRGVWHAMRGETATALTAYLRAREIALAADGPTDRILTTIEHNIGIFELALGRFDAGLEILKSCEAPLREAGDAETLAQVLAAQAWALDYLDREVLAERLYDEAIGTLEAVARERGGGQPLAPLLEQRAEFFLNAGRPRAALADLERARAEDSSGPLYEAYLDLRTGQALAMLGSDAQGIQRLDRARSAFEALDVQHGRLAAHLELARALRADGRADAARVQLESALQLTETLRGDLDLPVYRRSFLADQHEVYVELVDLLASADEEDSEAAAFDVAEAGRARSLLEGLELSTLPDTQGEGPPSGRDRSLESLSEQRLVALQAGDLTTSETLAGEIRRRRWESARREQSHLRKAGERRAAPSPRRLEEIQKKLDDETVLLAFVLGAERSWLFRVDHRSIEAIERSPRAEIERLALAVHEQLSGGAPWAGAGLLVDADLAALADRLFDEVDLGAGRLALLADGALHLVPFGLLPIPDPSGTGGSRLLLEDHEIVVLPSASVLVSLREEIVARPPAPELLALVADPVYSAADERFEPHVRSRGTAWTFPRLPASAEEARRLAALTATHEPLVRLGFDASAELIESGALRGYRWLHFAIHAFLDPRFPEQSGLVLSLVDREGRPADGLLQPSDLGRLDLDAELVVLSACDTALGERLRGEGVVGLAQALFTGGATRLVASLWEVQDSEQTVRFMESFYRGLLAGRPPAASLRDAQLEQHRQGVSPNQWAAFVFIGPWDPLAPLLTSR
ncbi:MAG: CHAT domain-containing protein [Acidobacteriota bacterium]